MTDRKRALTCRITGETVFGDFILLDAAEWAANEKCPECGAGEGQECTDSEMAITPWVHAIRAKETEE